MTQVDHADLDETVDVPDPMQHQDGQAPDGRWLDDGQQRAWRAFLLGSSRLNDALNRQLEAEAGMSLSEYEVLVRLSESPQRTLRMSELAAELVFSRSRLTHTVRRMEDRSLVERRTCRDDGRGVNCVLTDTGFATLQQTAPGHVDAVRRHMVDLLTTDQLRALGEAMAIVAQGPSPQAPAAAGSGTPTP
ncbi:MarR family winged helix-turn-helix transcriptional regulator [Actinotalea sp. K2]|uniref:MarR family winged helix-turn-helix transcriptional regulator n=1 Tax=Actinotalea sp. K2 TaxID=2939438 RepID=UPI002016EE3D|nr:MarR family winged helix-turn-helix transcriptional regulator [Actinotalea sp. K2]MCL3863059.1 MarR family winged helix-turn-helix transcriptional regulator [Actinotalea sp. K2]